MKSGLDEERWLDERPAPIQARGASERIPHGESPDADPGLTHRPQGFRNRQGRGRRLSPLTRGSLSITQRLSACR